MSNAAVVTGIGALTAVGWGAHALGDALRHGHSGITYQSEDGLGVAARLPRIDFDQIIAGLPLAPTMRTRALRAGRRAPRAAQVTLLAALEAWGGAFGPVEAETPDAINLVVAGNNVNQSYQRAVMQKFESAPDYVPASYALHFQDTDLVGLVSEVLGLRGEGCTVGAASASGNLGVLQGLRQIRFGLCSACVVVGAMTDLSPVELQAFAHAGALGGRRFAGEPARACRPFDVDRDGFIYGQGSACVILENETRARVRGATIWGSIAGAAVCLDGNRSSDPNAEGEVRAMQRALTDAGQQPEDVDYVNAHATASVLGDETEVKALRALFGAHAANVAVNGTKALLGHCLNAAGVVELVATLLQMKGGFLHANPNLENPIDTECRFIRLTAEARPSRLALSNAFGFGGFNTSIVVRRAA